jgi:hypothetical protein
MIAISTNQATIKLAERSVLREDTLVELYPWYRWAVASFFAQTKQVQPTLKTSGWKLHSFLRT